MWSDLIVYHIKGWPICKKIKKNKIEIILTDIGISMWVTILVGMVIFDFQKNKKTMLVCRATFDFLSKTLHVDIALGSIAILIYRAALIIVICLIPEEDPKSPSMVTWAMRTLMDGLRSRTRCTTVTSSPLTSWPMRRSSQSAQCAQLYSNCFLQR